MTTPADPQPNERKFRFKDEWLVSLVATMPGVTQELIKRWRFQQKPYIAQALIDGDVLSFKEIAEVVGTGEPTVKSRMRYALEGLRKALEALGVDGDLAEGGEVAAG